MQEWFGAALSSPWQVRIQLIADERTLMIEQTLIELVDREHCHLVLTTGGTGATPEATLAVVPKEMSSFGKQMRQISLQFVPTGVLSRQVAVIRESADHAALILNQSGQPANRLSFRQTTLAKNCHTANGPLPLRSDTSPAAGGIDSGGCSKNILPPRSPPLPICSFLQPSSNWPENC